MRRPRSRCSTDAGVRSQARACAQTARDLAWEVKRGGEPDAGALRQTIDESERVLDQLGQIERAIAEMKAALW